MRELGQYTQKWCADCRTGVVQVRHNGVTMPFERVDHDGPLYTLGVDHTMGRFSVPAVTYRPHRCPEAVTQARLEHQLALDAQHGKFVPKITAEVAKAYDVPCPVCGATSWEKCWNLSATKNPQHTQNPHEKRLRAGLRAQRLYARPLDSRGWGSRGYVLEHVDAKAKPWRKAES